MIDAADDDPSGTATHCDPTVGWSTVSKHMLPRQSRRVEFANCSTEPSGEANKPPIRDHPGFGRATWTDTQQFFALIGPHFLDVCVRAQYGSAYAVAFYILVCAVLTLVATSMMTARARTSREKNTSSAGAAPARWRRRHVATEAEMKSMSKTLG